MKSQQAGYVFAILTFIVFASQDAITRHLAESYHPASVSFIRYCAFAVFAIFIASRAPGGIRAAINTRHPVLQVLRGLLLVSQIMVGMMAFHDAGLVKSQAIFASSPILVAILAVPLLGEKVGWRRIMAIVAGLFGVLVILNPTDGNGLDRTLTFPLLNAVLMAAYAICTRIVSRDEAASTSFFYLGIVGWLATMAAVPFYWQPIARQDWHWMAIICVTGVVSHYLLILAYNRLDAIQVQPISYFQLVWASVLGVVIFGETLHWNVLAGSMIVVCAGLFTIWREALKRRMTSTE